MKKARSYLSYIYLPILFAAFFLLHGYNENFGLIPVTIIVKLLVEYTLIGIMALLLLSIFFQEKGKLILCFSLFLITYFFFGAIKDFLFLHLHWSKLYRYQFFLPLLLLFFIGSSLLIYRKQSAFQRFPQYLLSLLVLLILAEAGIFLFKSFTGVAARQDFGDRNNELIKDKTIADTTAKPDIYWLVFDMYPSSKSLLKDWGYSNGLDSELVKRGFYIAADAVSNYNYTHYSLSSLLDMTYLEGFDSGKEVSARDEVRGDRALQKNNVVSFLSANGYQISNYSFFDMEGAQSKGYTLFRDYPSDLIDDQTLSTRIYKDVLWNVPALFSGRRNNWDSSVYMGNARLHDSLQKDLLKKFNGSLGDSSHTKPVFQLLHIFLPHEPLIYNEDGSINPDVHRPPSESFIPQVKYTNKVIQQLVDAIQKVTHGNAVIIVQGDHGYKYDDNDKRFDSSSCQILFSLYLPARDYSNWYSSVSGVNSFRLLFNQLFHTKFPLLKDRSLLLRHHRR